MTCPSGVTVQNAPSSTVPVTYPPPTTTGGVAPITSSCTHPSGGEFNVGTTDVVCTARDSAAPPRQTSCVFSVTVTQSFVTSATRFMAVGDSITEGEVQYNTGSMRLRAIEPDKAYPTILRSLLASRYPQQEMIVHNVGKQGQPVVCSPGSSFCGMNTISDALIANRPQVLLLLQGVVDLSSPEPGDTEQTIIDRTVEGLRYMIREARGRDVSHVFLGTLLPQKPGQRDWAINLIAPANVEIRDLAARENVYLVDIYAAMVGQEATLIGIDGLHPTPEGYVVMANTFFEAIRSRLETTVTTPAGVSRMLRVSSADGPDVKVGPQFLRPPIRTRQR